MVNDVFSTDIIEFMRIGAVCQFCLQCAPLILVTMGKVLDKADFTPVVSHPGKPTDNIKDCGIVSSLQVGHCLVPSTDRVLAVAHNVLIQARY